MLGNKGLRMFLRSYSVTKINFCVQKGTTTRLEITRPIYNIVQNGRYVENAEHFPLYLSHFNYFLIKI